MQQFVYKFESMSTPCELLLFSHTGHTADSLAQIIVKESKRLEKKYSYYNPSSLLYRINNREEQTLDAETKSILQRAKQYYGATNGIFDITVATIKELYRTLSDTAELEEKKAQLLPYMGCQHFTIKKNRINFDNPHTRIDLGGFVKEYAVDRAVLLAKKHNISAALINFGGDIYAYGNKPDNTPFKVGIKDPKNPQRHATFVILQDEALTTSASYERRYRVGATSYSHIIATKNTANTPNSVSVIASNCVESGIYSTALMIDTTLTTNNRVIIL